ncbi:hypothetical protein BY458DRAFT_527119 [Sporodiniella umbellata]|nr:hypothetical protein BY458DRAFT_527119 [Sporodiniella umbellata]
MKGNCKFGTKCALLHTMSHYSTSAGTASSKTTLSDTANLAGRRNIGERPFLGDPFASSAPAVSLFGQQLGESSLWGQSPRSHRDPIGLYSSPRESSDILGSNSYLNSGYFSSSGFSIPTHHDHGYDLNDAMLPSSLNDLFTPTELHARRLRQQEDTVSLASGDWKVPFLSKNDCINYNDKTANNTSISAINIPGGNSNHQNTINNYIQQDELISPQHDDEVQFFMEDDEVIPNDHRVMDMTTQASRNQTV